MIIKISEILDLIILAGKAIKAYLLRKKKEEIKDAAAESLENKDQRKLEEAIGRSAGARTEYDEMYTRPRKKDEK